MNRREELVTIARAAALKAYSPYSGFRVGAVVVGPDGEMFTGANVENAAYPASSCAEATAVAHAVSQGLRQIDTIVVACIDAPDVDGAYPCGRCRQIMAEFEVQTVIVTGDAGSEIRDHSLEDLLPHRFRL
jgi:cytidine deaminase